MLEKIILILSAIAVIAFLIRPLVDCCIYAELNHKRQINGEKGLTEEEIKFMSHFEKELI